MLRMRLGFVIVVLALVAVGCGNAAENIIEGAIENQLEEEGGGGEVDIDIDEDGGVVSIETDEGSMSIGGTEIPDDFQLPLPDYEEVSGVISQTGELAYTQVVVSFDPDDFDDVVSLYEDYFNDEGWEVSRFESSGDGAKTVFVNGTKDEVSASVAISYTDGEDVATLLAQYGDS
jgi:hypothetical protein